ncbi:FAD/NAD(P)-binding protein [Streptomyces sp. NPDC021093]|uniref:FAD/NAD(P)-binding protein n=1 Tax=Streptomyces sp. NPDC021093 TaxID=3365112 RepID=UPI00378A528F
MALVGDGVGAAVLLDALSVGAAAPPGRITVVGPGVRRWRGLAFGADAVASLTNIGAAAMSVRPGDPGHYLRWAEATGTAGTAFPHRAVFGRYLEHTAGEAAARLRRRGCRVDVLTGRVTRVRRTPDGVDTRWEPLPGTAGAAVRRLESAAAVLCCGASEPADPYGLARSDGRVLAPYPLEELVAAVPPGARVAVAGTGLTAVDVACALADAGRCREITLVSRRGLLPSVRPAGPPHPVRHFTLDRIRTEGGLGGLLALLGAELAAEGLSFADLRVEWGGSESAADRLRRQLDDGGTAARALRVLRHAVGGTGAEAAGLLGLADRRRLDGRTGRKLRSLLFPMPAHTAVRVRELFDREVLRVVAGRIERGGGRGGAAFRVLPDAPGVGAVREADLVVNAVLRPSDEHLTEAEGVPPDSREGPVARMVREGHARAHPLGGVEADPLTGLLTGADGAGAPVHALGTLTQGVNAFACGLPWLARHSTRIAAALSAPG